MLGELINVSAEEKILDENGKIDLSLLKPILFDVVHNAYLSIGEKSRKGF